MIDNSSLYGLSNPMFTQDLGRAALTGIIPHTIVDMDDYVLSGGTNGYINSTTLMPMTPAKDTVEISGKTPKKKKSAWKQILIGAGVITGGILAIKFGKKGINAIRTGITKIINKFKKKPTTTP